MSKLIRYTIRNLNNNNIEHITQDLGDAELRFKELSGYSNSIRWVTNEYESYMVHNNYELNVKRYEEK